MYLIQFRLQLLIFTFYTRNTRRDCKHGRPQGVGGGGGGRGGGKSRPSPPPSKKIFWGYIEGLFATCSSYGGLAFYYVFLILGAFWLLFISWCRPFFGLAPPLRKFLRAHMIARRVREHAPPKFFV